MKFESMVFIESKGGNNHKHFKAHTQISTSKCSHFYLVSEVGQQS